MAPGGRSGQAAVEKGNQGGVDGAGPIGHQMNVFACRKAVGERLLPRGEFWEGQGAPCVRTMLTTPMLSPRV